MSTAKVKKTMVTEYFVCDICKRRMHPVAEPFERGDDTEDIHTDKFDAHVKCFEKLLTGEAEPPKKGD